MGGEETVALSYFQMPQHTHEGTKMRLGLGSVRYPDNNCDNCDNMVKNKHQLIYIKIQ